MNTVSLSVDIDRSNIANPDFLRLVEEMNRTHIPRFLKRENKTVAILLPVERNEQADPSSIQHQAHGTLDDNIIDFNQEIDTDAIKEKLSQPSDISALLEMSGIIEDAEDVSSDKKKYLY